MLNVICLHSKDKHKLKHKYLKKKWSTYYPRKIALMPLKINSKYIEVYNKIRTYNV